MKVDLAIICLLILNMAIVVSRLPFVKKTLNFLLVIQLFGTNGIAVLLMCASFFNTVAIVDLALVATLLAAVSALVFIKVFHKELGSDLD